VSALRDLIDAEWRLLDVMVRVDELTAELLELVRQHDVDVDRWPEDLESLANLVLHGLEVTER
jgi:hypothetical protein